MLLDDARQAQCEFADKLDDKERDIQERMPNNVEMVDKNIAKINAELKEIDVALESGDIGKRTYCNDLRAVRPCPGYYNLL